VIAAAVTVVMFLGKLWFLDPCLMHISLRDSIIPVALTSDPSNQAQQQSAKIVSWRRASEYIGTYAAVEGEIVATYNSGSVCYLNFHKNYSEHFTAVIFADDFSRFPEKPEQHYLLHNVRVYGTIKEYKGRPEIIVDSPGQIKLID